MVWTAGGVALAALAAAGILLGTGRSRRLRVRPLRLRAVFPAGTLTRYRLESKATMRFPRPGGLLARSRRRELDAATGLVHVVAVQAPAGPHLVALLRRPNISVLYGKPAMLWVYRADASGRPVPRVSKAGEGRAGVVRDFLRDQLELGRLGLPGAERLPDRAVRPGDTWPIGRTVQSDEVRLVLKGSAAFLRMDQAEQGRRAVVRVDYTEDVESPWSRHQAERGRREMLFDVERDLLARVTTKGTLLNTAARIPFYADFVLRTGLEFHRPLSPAETAAHEARLAALDAVLGQTARGDVDAAVTALDRLIENEAEPAWREGMVEMLRELGKLRRRLRALASDATPVTDAPADARGSAGVAP